MVSGTLSGIVTGMLLALFVVGCAWAFSPRRRTAFDEAARLPLREDGAVPEPARPDAKHQEAGSEEGGVR